MADYGTQDSRFYGPGPGSGPGSGSRATSYGVAPGRDAAFAKVFGGPPPPRSQTMTSQTHDYLADRTASLTSSPQAMTPNGLSPQRDRPPQRNYDRVPSSGYPPSSGSGFPQSNGYGPPRPSQPNMPPVFNDRRGYPQPQRIDPRALGPGSSYPQKPGPNRMPPPALNTDTYRSRSMVRPGETPVYRPPPPGFQPGTAGYNRQQPYADPVSASATTAQGRQIPQRMGEERAMTMGNYLSERDHTQLTSGRIVPGRRRDSETEPFQERSATFTSSTMANLQQNGHLKTKHPSEGYVPSRAISTASGHSVDSNASTAVAPTNRTDSMRSRPHQPQHSSSGSTTQTVVQRRSPLVYPALLSRVAQAFQDRIGLGERSKDDFSYKNSFTGAEAVDLIAYIIKTTDRNLALLLGRALDAQKFFHDVTYEHRLRDAPGEVYQFRETMGETVTSEDVNGVFTLLTECYSPTCTKENLCYSIACPRRLEQQARLNMKPEPGLRHQSSKGSLHDGSEDDIKLWITNVPKDVSEKVDEREKKRQEIIFEIMYTERDFVKDLEYLRDFWIRPLRGSATGIVSPIKEEKREKFVRTVFGNCLDVLGVNGKFAEELSKRQKESYVVHSIGDVFLRWVPQFDPFIKYGANQMYGKFEFEKEKGSNLAFSRFVDETERLKESRKLELNGYLTKPTTRLARYPLLLDNVLKYTKEGDPDKKDIPRAIALIKDFLARVNTESGKAENHFNLIQLNQQLKWNPGEYTDLKLTEENRAILTKMSFKKSPTDNADIQVYLFDHAVLMCRMKTVNKREELRVYRKPIPLELLVIAEMDQVIPRLGIAKRPSSGLLPGTRTTAPANQKDTFPVTFRHLGKGAYELQLYASSHTQRKKFVEMVEAQQSKLRERNSNFYSKTILCESFFTAQNRVNCLVPTDGGRKLIYGTDNGIYLADRWPKDKSIRPRKILDAAQVSQIDTLEEYRLLLVLANKSLYSYPLVEALDVQNQNPLAVRPRKIQGHANFFKVGIGLGRHLVCAVKTTPSVTTIKVYEPTEDVAKRNTRSGIGRMFAGGQDALKPFKEFYLPAETSSVHYLRSTLCIGCDKGFEVVSLGTTERQSLLDQADTSLDFVTRKEHVKPIHIERLNGEFLLNYSDFSFFVNRNGWRARQDWKIQWEGTPRAFALNYPYILAFEPSFIEIRHLETSELIHVMTAKNVRFLHSSTREILYAYEDESGEDVIASLDFWSKAQQA